MENKKYLTIHNGDEYSNPFPIQIATGEKGKHCDKFPHGSLHLCQRRLKDDQIRKIIPGEKTIEAADIIPAAFVYKPLLCEFTQSKTKKCQSCPNIFPVMWPFAGDICIRCFERENIGHATGFSRDDYRELIRKELLQEMKELRKPII